jgi:two-component system sensor histidine kinase HydH
MMKKSKNRFQVGMQSSPWIILGSTVILLVVVMVLTYQNTNRQKQYMIRLLSEKGAAFIRAVEAGARSGMMGMMWDDNSIQLLIEETGRLPDVLYMAVVDDQGRVLAHSDPSQIDKPFDKTRKITHLGPDQTENWELVTQQNGHQVFEVHRHFRPLSTDHQAMNAHMQSMMQHHRMNQKNANEWLLPGNLAKVMIIVGLDVSPFKAAIESDIQTTVILSIVMLLLGFGGFVSLFWMNSYRSARKSLKDTSAVADEIVSHLPVGLVATDQQRQVTFFNNEAERITGFTQEQVTQMMPNEFLSDELSQLYFRIDKGTPIIDQEMLLDFKHNPSMPISVSAIQIHNDMGEFVGKLLIIKDLTEIRKLQEEIQQQEKLATIGSLAAGVAHEVRNPLSSIKALATYFSGLFTAGTESSEAADVLIQEVDRLNRVITELLEFARPSELNRKSEDINMLLSNSIRLIRQDAANKNIKVQLDAEENLCPVWMDADRMTQSLLNLYINALQAMEASGQLSIRACSAEGDNVEITVKDTGKGIAHEDLYKIFDPYFTTKQNGTGLGLAIVRKIVDGHKGKIKIGRAHV